MAARNLPLPKGCYSFGIQGCAGKLTLAIASLQSRHCGGCRRGPLGDRMTVRQIILGAFIALAGLSVSAQADDYPTRTIKVIVPYTPGSPVDAAARVLTQALAQRLGQSVVVGTRPGGGTTIGMKSAATSVPDGYTLLFSAPQVTPGPGAVPAARFRPARSPRAGGDIRDLVTRDRGGAERAGEDHRRIGGLCEGQSRQARVWLRARHRAAHPWRNLDPGDQGRSAAFRIAAASRRGWICWVAASTSTSRRSRPSAP